MITVAWDLLKRVGPYLVIVLIAYIIWLNGYETANNKHIEYVASLKQQTKTLFQQAEIKNSDIKHTLNESARIIEEQSHEHNQTIETLTKRNRDILADRMRNAYSCTSAMPNDSATTESSDGTSSGYWMVQRAVAERLVNRHEQADKVAETALACQAYVKSIQEAFNEHKMESGQH